MTRDEQEFEEWFDSEEVREFRSWVMVNKISDRYLSKQCFLASRRLLREEIDKQLEKEGWEDKGEE